jgi:aminobenzoyl-glutamate utilization protein A
VVSAKDITPLILSLSDECQSYVVSLRRDFHQHAEVGFAEFRTAGRVIQELQKYGFQVAFGKEANRLESRLGVPPAGYLERAMKKAIKEGADPDTLKRMEGGLTGVVGVLKCGPGPVFAARFDMDANEMTETDDPAHHPVQEGFASRNPGACHGCGHDGHTAIGLGVARVLAQIQPHLRGTVKLIFQPAEEGVRGARPMVDAGVIDDVDYFIFSHLGLKIRETGVITTARNILATTKLRIDLQGIASHPLASPEKGRNALLAASTAALAIHSIPPLGEGTGFRIANVGVLNAGLAQGIIAPNAHLEVATFADSDGLNADLAARVIEIVTGIQKMFGVSANIIKVGESFTATSDAEWTDKVKKVAQRISFVKRTDPPVPLAGAEDGTFFMRRVQDHGGKACCLLIGAELASEHHNPYFDFDEKALDIGTRLLALIAYELLSAGFPKDRQGL